jgi:hypothetical protein
MPEKVLVLVMGVLLRAGKQEGLEVLVTLLRTCVNVLSSLRRSARCRLPIPPDPTPPTTTTPGIGGILLVRCSVAPGVAGRVRVTFEPGTAKHFRHLLPGNGSGMYLHESVQNQKFVAFYTHGQPQRHCVRSYGTIRSRDAALDECLGWLGYHGKGPFFIPRATGDSYLPPPLAWAPWRRPPTPAAAATQPQV